MASQGGLSLLEIRKPSRITITITITITVIASEHKPARQSGFFVFSLAVFFTRHGAFSLT
jgi:hypothetical protein